MTVLRCNKCGNMVEFLDEKHKNIICCGEQMEALNANSTDAAGEKHVPVIEVNGKNVTVTVGSVEHPMQPEHHIAWIELQTKMGIHREPLKAGDAPKACFTLCDGDEVVAAYEYCNLHGLWKADK